MDETRTPNENGTKVPGTPYSLRRHRVDERGGDSSLPRPGNYGMAILAVGPASWDDHRPLFQEVPGALESAQGLSAMKESR